MPATHTQQHSYIHIAENL